MSDLNIKKLLQVAFESCQDVKGEDINVIDLTKISSYTDYVLLASAGSDRQVKSIADRIMSDVFKKCKRHPLGVEGYDSGEWVLIDFGDIVCHIFLDEWRKVYRLEDMWPQVTALNEDKAKKFLELKKSPSKSPIKKVVAKKAAAKKTAAKTVRVRRAAKSK